VTVAGTAVEAVARTGPDPRWAAAAAKLAEARRLQAEAFAELITADLSDLAAP
jgi:hypothetical protein